MEKFLIAVVKLYTQSDGEWMAKQTTTNIIPVPSLSFIAMLIEHNQLNLPMIDNLKCEHCRHNPETPILHRIEFLLQALKKKIALKCLHNQNLDSFPNRIM